MLVFCSKDASVAQVACCTCLLCLGVVCLSVVQMLVCGKYATFSDVQVLKVHYRMYSLQHVFSLECVCGKYATFSDVQVSRSRLRFTIECVLYRMCSL